MKIEFKTRRQEAMSLRKSGCTYKRTASLMNICEKSVWMHCTSSSKNKYPSLILSEQDIIDTYNL